MLTLNNPYSQEEIIAATQTVGTYVGDFFSGLSPERFTYETEGVWSAQSNLQHMLLSLKPLAKAISMSPDRLEKMFGRSDRSSEDYDVIVQHYQKKLEEGLRAEGSGFEPVGYRMPEDVEDVQAYLLEEWHKTIEKYLAAIDEWSDTDLDAYLLPHPAVPDMTVREMLMFTLYHNIHHVEDVTRLLESAAI